MNARRLLVTLAVLVTLGIALSSRSTLTPQRGADHVFYGAGMNNFVGQYAVVGDFNFDGYDDVVTSALWDDPTTGGVTLKGWTKAFQGSDGPPTQKDPWGTIIAEKGGVKRRVCDFPGAFGDEHWEYWESLGWSELATGDHNFCYTGVQCDSCYSYEIRSEDQGALYVVDGASSWTSKGHDINFASTAPTHLIPGKLPGDKLYSGLAVGKTNNDSYEDLLASATGANNSAGEAYVIKGASSWSGTIDLSTTTLLQHTFKGRDAGDLLGNGIAVGDLDGDNLDDIVLSASGSSGLGNSEPAAGEIYIFYSSATIPATVNLAGLTDNQVDALGYVSVIYGPADSSQVGVTPIKNWHGLHNGWDAHQGGYEPIGLAIGRFDDDAYNDLAIGAGWAEKSAAQVFAGAVYIIFGTDPNGAGPHKLAPGNRIDLANAAGTNANAPDMKFVGKTGGRLGAGVAFLDANDQGLGAYKDLVIGAPFTTTGGKSQCGEAYIVFGDAKATLLTTRTRNVGTGGHVNVTIIGEDAKDRLGSQFEGNDDVDEDGNNDVGMVGEREKYVYFVPSGGSWASSIDLADVEETSPSTRIIEMEGDPTARSVTIRFAHVDNDVYGDLVFGGYDNPGYPGDNSGAIHAGQMWVAKGHEFLWQGGVISSNTNWSGNVFVHDDIVVEDGATLTIEAGTDVWIWPKDPDISDDVWPSYPLHFDTTRVEFRVYGDLVVDGDPGNAVRIQAWTMNGPTSDESDLWWGIHVHDGSATFDYCEIRNARQALSANAPLTITNSTIEHVSIIGMNVAGSDSVYVDNLTMRDIGYTGIRIDGMRVRVSDSALSELGDYGINAFGGAKLYVDDTAIRDADYEAISLEEEDSFASIIDCMIEDNYRGLRAEDEAVMVVEGTTIDASDSYGVYSLDDATIGVEGCTVTNAVAGIAIYESNATLVGNLLQNNDVGLYSLQGSAPTVEGCDISYNDIGVLATQGGLPMMGYGGGYGYNEIHHSTTYHVSNLTPVDTLRAESNHWKITTGACFPTSGKINGKVDYIPSLCSPPSPVSSQPLVPTAIPVAYGLSPNYPNPFNPVTTVPFAVPTPGGKVTIAIFNVRGQLVRTLVNGTKQPGHHTVEWDGTNNQGSTLASGIYFLHMRAPGFQQTRKLALLK